MKGIIILGFNDYYMQKSDTNEWKGILKKAGLSENSIILPSSDIEDRYVPAIAAEIGKKLKIPLQNILIEVGKSFVNTTMPKYYKFIFLKHKTFHSFVMDMNKNYSTMLQLPNDPNYNLSMFDINYQDNVYLVKYISARGIEFLNFAQGCFIATAEYYKVKADIVKLNQDTLQIKIL